MKDYFKEFVGQLIEKRLKDSENVSAQLMKQCIRQDKTEFNEKNLDAIDPRYKQELWNMIKEEASARWDALNELEAKNPNTKKGPANLEYVVDLATLTGAEKVSTREHGRRIDSIDSLNKPPRDFSAQEVRSDLARALGHVRIKLNNHGVTVSDDFDFKGSFTSTPALVATAGMHKVLSLGENTDALTNIGRIFCKEENGKASESSIPVKITLDVAEMGGYLPPKKISSLNSKAPTK
jgi:hypothetical protein